MHDSRTLLHTSDIKPHMGMILTIYNYLDTYIYQAEGYSCLPTTLWCCMDTSILSELKNYCKQSNSIIVTVYTTI